MTDINIDGIVTWLKNWFQEKLVSGTNIKTINNQSVLGSGNINISGGSSVTVDDALSSTSTNPVQNKVVNTALGGKQASLSVESTSISVSSPTSGSNYFSGGTREILARRYGKIVNVTINFYNVNSKQASTSTDTAIGTMPSGWRPIFNQYARASYTNKSDIHNTSFMINTSGTISIRTLTTTAQTSVTYRASFTYIVS